jgi:hypothetical protein
VATDQTRTTDERDRLALFALRVWGYKQGEVVSLMIHLSDRLGLFKAMTGAGPMTSAELAVSTGLHQPELFDTGLVSALVARLVRQYAPAHGS